MTAIAKQMQSLGFPVTRLIAPLNIRVQALGFESKADGLKLCDCIYEQVVDYESAPAGSPIEIIRAHSTAEERRDARQMEIFVPLASR